MTNMNMNKMRKEVNRLDRKYNAKLNNPDFYKEPDAMFFLSCMEFQSYIRDVIKELNGVSSSVKTEHIAMLSKLEWKQNRTYDIDTWMYRSRFLTLFLTEISDHIAELCEKEYRYHSPGVGIYEHAYFYLLEITKHVQSFIHLFLDGNDWSNLIVKMLEYSFMLRVQKKKRAERLIEGSKDLILEIRKGAKKPLIGSSPVEEPVLVNYIFQLTVLMCSGTGKCNAVPPFEYFEKKKLGEDDYRYEIAYLGKAILGSHKDYTKCALFYQIFQDASPDLSYDFPNINTNMYLNVGCRALEFTRFILNDKYCNRLIDKMLNRYSWLW